jgi:hypothetical protein
MAFLKVASVMDIISRIRIGGLICWKVDPLGLRTG